MNEFNQQRHEAKRSAFEEVFVGPRGRKRYFPRGLMATSRTNNAEGSPDRAAFELSRLGIPGLVGEVTLRPVRVPRADGTKGRPIAPADAVAVERVLTAAPEDLLWAARMEVERAITRGEFMHGYCHVHVSVTPLGRIKTIPDKGEVLTWASVDHLALALATGAF